jgi:hypothetical protein
MRLGRTLTTATGLLLASAGMANAEKILKSEPREGNLRSGERVLVDDGTCPGGQIKEIIGGSNREYQTSIPRPGTPRSIKCIPR